MNEYVAQANPSNASIQSGFIKNRSDGRPVAYFKPRTGINKFYELRLSGPIGPKVGPSPLTRQSVKDLTDIERAWLKKHYGGEFEFMQTLGLKMHKEEDRSEGRVISRSFMSDDGDVSSGDAGNVDHDFGSLTMSTFGPVFRP
ncbi:hypothetical protein AK830_g4423 [Neonectria ditissima]|uniref:Uncharacterized protein n=1 Tax=Neonectria ditissima TaxID=78410 RepID=A0A0P7AW60_9HYPO|nr:hypothetical protein AK830_g4423 [Neonectria ditissima]